MSIAATSTAQPKSYLPQERHEELARHGDMELVYMAEAREAAMKFDMDAAWAWMSLVKLPPTALKMLKTWNGSRFIRDKRLDTTLADAEYGSGWLERE